eukprot:433034_1
MLQESKITESNIFWKQFGNTINNNEQFLSIVKKYPNLQNKIILLRLFEDLKIYPLIDQYFAHIMLPDNLHVDAYDNILIKPIDNNSLKTTLNKIMSNYVFVTSNETDTFLDKLYTFIKENNKSTQQQMESLQQYLNYNEYDTDSVTEDINCWITNEHDEINIKSNIYKHFKHVLGINFLHTDLQIISGLIQDSENANGKQFTFNNIEEFKVPLIGSDIDSLFHLYVKDLNNTFS